MAVRKYDIPVTTTGSAGSATGEGYATLGRGELLALHFDYHASAPATTDVVVSLPGEPSAQTVLTVNNTGTDAWHYPSVALSNASGVADATRVPPVVQGGAVKVAVTGCDALTEAVSVTAFVRV